MPTEANAPGSDVTADVAANVAAGHPAADTDARPPLLSPALRGRAPKVAILRLDNIGDHVLASGFLAAFKTWLPDAHLTMFTSESARELYQSCPHVDAVVGLSAKASHLAQPADIRLAAEQIRLAGSGPFDVLINPRFAEDFYGAARLACEFGAPVRIAFEQSDPAANSAYTALIQASDQLHVSAYSSLLLGALFGEARQVQPRVWWSPADQISARDKLQRAGWDGKHRLLMLAPGACDDYRAWPADQVADLLARLQDAAEFQVILTGSRGEAEHWSELRKCGRARCLDMVGVFTLPELAACCRLTELFVGTDSGPKHIAAAVGVPSIEIGYLPRGWPSRARGLWTSGECWAPCATRFISLRPAAGFSRAQVMSGAAIRSISAEQVLAAVQAMQAIQADCPP